MNINDIENRACEEGISRVEAQRQLFKEELTGTLWQAETLEDLKCVIHSVIWNL